MLKIEVSKGKKDESKMNCKIQCVGSVVEIIAETAEVIKKIRESLAENGPEVEAAFATAIAAATMNMDLEALSKEIMSKINKDEDKNS